ncbi:hypothetical protein GCM10009085_18970 [Pseudomonas avellanae]|nr:hypothetical protein GCM10009085_18970 [Pseudomonas avellanae]
MNEIQALKDRRDQLLKEADQLHTQLLPLEAALENEQSIEPAQERELRDKYNELKTRRRMVEEINPPHLKKGPVGPFLLLAHNPQNHQIALSRIDGRPAQS